MKPVLNHDWDITETQALSLQNRLSQNIIKTNCFNKIQLVAGVDVAYDKHSNHLVAAIVILNPHTLEIIETTSAVDNAIFPYIPGLFSFRELPSLIKAFAKLQNKPDLVICDGQGYAHPRRFGLACHLGLIFDIPSIGCGKTKLIGKAQATLAAKRGSMVDLLDKNEVIGRELRTQDNIKPTFVSIGYKINLEAACEWVLKLSPKYRLPETTRQADQLVKKLLKT